MEKKLKERERKNNSQLRAYLLTALIIIGIVALGLLAVNQFLEFKFKAHFLGCPCSLCEELNPHLKKCFEDASNVVVDQTTGEVVSPYEIDVGNFSWEE